MEKTECIRCKYLVCEVQALYPPKYFYTCTNEKCEFYKKLVDPFGTCEKSEALYNFFEGAEECYSV